MNINIIALSYTRKDNLIEVSRDMARLIFNTKQYNNVHLFGRVLIKEVSIIDSIIIKYPLLDNNTYNIFIVENEPDMIININSLNINYSNYTIINVADYEIHNTDALTTITDIISQSEGKLK